MSGPSAPPGGAQRPRADIIFDRTQPLPFGPPVPFTELRLGPGSGFAEHDKITFFFGDPFYGPLYNTVSVGMIQLTPGF